MPSNNESQCYFIQLQIDDYLDGGLNDTQQSEFTSHVKDCSACAREFRYARTMQDAVMELPQIECADYVLEPVHGLTTSNSRAKEDLRNDSWIIRVLGPLNSSPLFYRYGFSAALLAVVAVTISLSVVSPTEEPGQIVASEVIEQYSPEDIAVALQELNVAIEYLNQLSQRTEVMIGDRFLVTPLQNSIKASFQRARARARDPLQNGPI